MNTFETIYNSIRNISARVVMLFTLLIYITTAFAEPNYFYFECTEGTATIKLAKKNSAPTVSLQYSFTCESDSWENFTSPGVSISTRGNSRVYFRATTSNPSFATSISNYNYFQNTGTGVVKAGGNIASLLDVSVDRKVLYHEFTFALLFTGMKNLYGVSELLLPFTTLSNNCFYGMFYNCTSLVNAPQILPAQTLANSCYMMMFYGCVKLNIAPQLPATSMVSRCYMSMFEGCSSLLDAPDLPALNLVDECYARMFNNCRNLKYINASFLIIPSNFELSNWVYNVSSIGVFMKNPNAQWANTASNNGIPSGWTVCYGDAFAGGNGASQTPFLISNKQQMANLLNLLSGRASFNSFTDLISLNVTQFTGETNFKLTADLDYSNGLSYYSENGTIGAKYLSGIIETNADPSSGGVFTGVFDGGNHTIAGIKGCRFYEKTTGQFADDKGLFYDVNGAIIKNLAVVNSYNIFGTTSLSGNVTFENCCFSFDPQATRYKTSTDNYTAIGATDNTYVGNQTAGNVTLNNCYWADYASQASTKERGIVYYSSDVNTSNTEQWQKDEVSMLDRYILKSMAVTLSGDDGQTYTTDKLMLQPRTNTLMKAKKVDKCGLEFKYNVYTVDAEKNEATIQNLYLNDYSVVNKNNWRTKFTDNNTAIRATDLVFNNTYDKVHLKSVNYERVVSGTATGEMLVGQTVMSQGSDNSWMSFCLPYSVSKMYGYYFKGVKENSKSLCFAKLKSTTELNQPADAFMVNAKDLVYTNEVVDYIHVNGKVDNNTFTVSASRVANGEDIPFTMNDRSSSEDNFVGVFKTETGANLYPQLQNLYTYKISGSGVINKTINTSWIYPFRTYLRVDASDEVLFPAVSNSKTASSMFFEEDEVTAVREVKFSGNSFDTNDRYASTDDEFYTVSGMKISNVKTSLNSGVYVNNQRKIIVR